MTRNLLRIDELRELVADQFGTDRRITTLHRLVGGTNKGVYRLTLDDGGTAVLYVWGSDESYWPPAESVADDPFADATGAELFAANSAALTAVGVRTPRLLMIDRDGRYLDADTALVEDAGGVRLEMLLERDPQAAAAPLAALGDALRRMHTTTGQRYGKVVDVARGVAPQARPVEDVVSARASRHLDAVAARDARLADAQHRIAAHLHRLRAAVTPRTAYGLVHGELGPDHVLVTPAGEVVLIDIEGLTHLDVEWEHAFLQLRFGAAYPALRPVALDADRLELYRFAQILSLIEGPLRIADTDFPDRAWMRRLAEANIGKALAAVGAAGQAAG